MSQIAIRKRRNIAKTETMPRQEVVAVRRQFTNEAAVQRRELAMLLRSIKTMVRRRP